MDQIDLLWSAGALWGQRLCPCSICPWHYWKDPCFVVTTGCSRPIVIISASRHEIISPPRNPLQVICAQWSFSFDRLGVWILLFLLYQLSWTIKALTTAGWRSAASPLFRGWCSCCRSWPDCPSSHVFKCSDGAANSTHLGLAFVIMALVTPLPINQLSFQMNWLLREEGPLYSTPAGRQLPCLPGWLCIWPSGLDPELSLSYALCPKEV